MRDQENQAEHPVDGDIYTLADESPDRTREIRNGNGNAPHIRTALEAHAARSTPSSPAAGPSAPETPQTPNPANTAGPLGWLASFRKRSAPGVDTPPAADAPSAPAPRGGINLRGKRIQRRNWTQEAPAWALSAIVHGTIFGVLAVAGLTPQVQVAFVKTLDSARFGVEASEEEMPILADPTALPSPEAVGPVVDIPSAGGGNSGLGSGSGPPSATPTLANVGHGSSRGIGEGSLPNIKVSGPSSPLAPLPVTPGVDLEGRGGVGGDVLVDVEGVGEALDQLAREILRKLGQHKLTVIWLFDESGSMKDDQQAIKEKFDRVATELKLGLDAEQKEAKVLTHAIVGFGSSYHVELPKPTADIDQIAKAIDRLSVDETGAEYTLEAIQQAIGEYSKLITNDHRLMIVLVTDESGDDGDRIEEARQVAVSHDVPVYVIGRQSLFGYDRAHLLYVDPVTKDPYWPVIKRGPEAAGYECLQWDGLHERWDEQPAGLPPYELARIVKDSSGIYFLLPNEENLRVRRTEQRYQTDILREYLPKHTSRAEYIKTRNASTLRRTMYEIIEGTKEFGFRRHYPVDYAALEEAILNEVPIVRERLTVLMQIETQLRALRKEREREPEKRWQAHFDLMLAQIVCAQIKAYEYLACIDEMVGLARKGQLRPSEMPDPNRLGIDWVLDHSKDRKAPPKETEEKYAEATRLFQDVIARHPKTPWADLARDYLNRGFGVQRNEWKYNPKYQERAKNVPKY